MPFLIDEMYFFSGELIGLVLTARRIPPGPNARLPRQVMGLLLI